MKNAKWKMNLAPPLDPLPCQFRLKNTGFRGRGKYIKISRLLFILHSFGVLLLFNSQSVMPLVISHGGVCKSLITQDDPDFKKQRGWLLALRGTGRAATSVSIKRGDTFSLSNSA